MAYYCGYLSPRVPHIKALHLAGAKGPEICEFLARVGVTASPAMVNYVLKRVMAKPKPVPPVKTTRVVIGWQTWTPEMQEAEFQMGYSR